MVGYLRLILAALVVYSHLNFAPWLLIGVHINQGVFAVFSFYLISGFFTAAIFDRHLGEHQLRNYYIDRTLRIYPMFVAVIVLTGLVGIFHYEPSLKASPSDYLDPQVWLMALLQPLNGLVAFLFQGDFPYGPFFAFTPVASLALEVKYFAVFPAVRHIRYELVALLALACTLLLASSLKSGNPDMIESFSYRYLIGVLPTFLVGFLIYRNIGEATPKWMRGEYLSLGLGILLLAAIKVVSPVSTRWVGEMALALIVTPWLLIAVLKIRRMSHDSLAGYLSYGVFLVHIPILRFLHLREASLWQFGLALGLATLISYFLHVWIERRVLSLRHTLGKPKEIRISAT
jgi:peptidoglycan/LPS O-acetylase OafA/YrhL